MEHKKPPKLVVKQTTKEDWTPSTDYSTTMTEPLPIQPLDNLFKKLVDLSEKWLTELSKNVEITYSDREWYEGNQRRNSKIIQSEIKYLR